MAAGVMALVPLQEAKAVCTTGAFNFCFNFTFSNGAFSVTFNPTGSGSTSNGFLTEFGLWGFTPGITSPGVPSFNGGAGWATSSPNNGNCPGLGSGNDVGAGAFQLCVASGNGNPATQGLGNNQTVSLTFTGNPVVGQSGVDVHIQAVNGTSCSIRVGYVDGADHTTTGALGSDCISTTPEPAGVALMATGLVGLGGVAIRRRRRS